MLGYCLTVALVTERLGLGLELGSFNSHTFILCLLSHCVFSHWITIAGAFIAGLTVIEHGEVEQTMKVTNSLRWLFGGMFFLSLGLIMSPRFVFNNFLVILALAIVVMFIKWAVSAFIVRCFQ
jgi:Kef-type K+ transport system membrane component KefB